MKEVDDDRPLVIVEDVFDTVPFGIVVAPGIDLHDYPPASAIPVEVVKPEGSAIRCTADIYYPFPVPAPKEPKSFVRLIGISKTDVPIGSLIRLQQPK